MFSTAAAAGLPTADSKFSPAPGASTISLTAEEQGWLRAHPRISVAQDPSWPPIEFTGDRGEAAGITGDYLLLIEQRLGIKFERVRGLTWQQAYDRLQRREIDMTTTVAVTPERTKFWAFTKPYLTIPIVIATNSDVPYVGSISELAGKKVAVVDGYISAYWLSRDYPSIKIVRVKTVKEGLDALQRKETFAFMKAAV